MKTLLKFATAGALLLTSLVVPAFARVELPGRDDAELAVRVAKAIHQYSHFGMFDDVRIAVEDRVVTLTGLVTRPVKRDDIGKRVARVDGVREVRNGIEVLPISPSDDDLRLRVARAIYNHSSFRQYASMALPPIHIIVRHGHVTLTGRVATELDRALANALAQVRGAFSVTNDLALDPR